MAAALLREYAARYPEMRFTMVSQAFLKPLFEGVENIRFVAVNTQEKHKGLCGLWRLFRELRAVRPDVFVDLHSVLRSLIIRTLFFVTGAPVYFLKKGRQAKRQLTRRRRKKIRPLKSMFRRYEQVLQKALHTQTSLLDSLPPITIKNTATAVKKIGIAPFARYKGKSYPLEKMETVVAHFAVRNDLQLFLFGGGKEEARMLADWEMRYPSVTSVAGKISLEEELQFMQQLFLMLSMDSANMHFASLKSVPVISVWGATHPFAGFYGWRQQATNALQVELPCRPCSVFGNKNCYREDYACLQTLEPAQIINKIETLLALKGKIE